jgi:hypothetical protein
VFCARQIFYFQEEEMEAFLEKVAEINGSINGVVWGIFGLTLLIGTGIIVTISTKAFQVSHLPLWWKNTIGSMFTKNVMKHRKEKGVISPFQALCTALAATIGEEAVTLEDVYEPYLMQLGFLTRTPRGRCATRLAYEHLQIAWDGQVQFDI